MFYDASVYLALCFAMYKVGKGDVNRSWSDGLKNAENT